MSATETREEISRQARIELAKKIRANALGDSGSGPSDVADEVRLQVSKEALSLESVLDENDAEEWLSEVELMMATEMPKYRPLAYQWFLRQGATP